MLLSIAMIVKNEEKNIERCLKAIKALNGKINYEIVIVDTGSVDNTIDIAKKYTERIYEHKWKNNFAEMRNISLKYCKGDWILVLDADEVIEEAEEIVSFLKSNEAQRLSCAVVKLKNMLSDDKNNYLIGNLVRLFKNVKDFFYTGIVHEQPNIVEPAALTNISILHYGYSREDYKIMKYKYERNEKLLLEDLKNKPNNIYTYFQLSQTYSMANRPKEALNTISKAFKLVKERIDLKEYLYIYHFYGRELLSIGNHEKSIEICEEAIKYSNEHLDFYYILSRCYSALNKYDEANKYFERYFILHKELEDGKLISDISVINFSFCKKDDILREKVLCSYKNKKFKDVEIAFKKIQKESFREELKEIYIYSLIRESKYEDIFKYYENNTIKENDINSIISIIERITADGILDDINEILKKLLTLNPTLDFYIKTIYLNSNIKNNELNFKYNNFYIWKANIIKKYLPENKAILEKLKNLNKRDISTYINFISTDYECLDILYDYSEENFLEHDIETLNLLVIIEENLLLSKSINNEKYHRLVQRSYINKLNYIYKVYNNEILQSVYANKILNQYEKVWIDIQACTKVYRTDKLAYINNLKNLLKEVPEYNRIIKYYLSIVDENNITEDMKNEKENLLNIVQQFIEQDKPEEALEILMQLQKLFKYDSEILNYLGVNYYVLGNYKEAILNLALSNTIEEKNFDNIYNLACVLEANSQLNTAKYYYTKAYELCENENLKEEILNIIK